MPHGTKYSSIVLIPALILSSFLFACQQEASEISPDKESVNSQLDKRAAELMNEINMYQFKESVTAPAFNLPSVDGGKISLQQFRGNVVLLSFWATW